MLNAPFDQYEFEYEMSQHFPYGSQETLAKALGRAPGLMSQYINPNDSRESPLYKAALMLVAMQQHYPDEAAAALELFTHFVNRSRMEVASTSTPAIICQTRRKVYHASEVAKLAEVENDGLEEVIRCYEKKLAADKLYLEALRAQQRQQEKVN